MKLMSLETPSKSAKKSPTLIFEEEETEQVEEVEDLRTQFVGDLEVTEGTSVSFAALNVSPDQSLKITSHFSSKRNDDLYCSPFSTLRYVFTRLFSRSA
jgi:hypothetical protein